MEDTDYLPPRKKKKDYLLPSPAFDLVMRNMLNTHSLVEMYKTQGRQVINEDDENVPPIVPKVRLRSCKKLNQRDPRHSSWYQMYVEHPDLTAKGLKKFRRRFRLPYAEFLKLRNSLLEEDDFSRWHTGKCDHFGSRASPIELLLLGTLRYLGRGLTFDDIEEGTQVSEECHRQFFHKFIG
jgi:hypothetical protein